MDIVSGIHNSAKLIQIEFRLANRTFTKMKRNAAINNSIVSIPTSSELFISNKPKNHIVVTEIRKKNEAINIPIYSGTIFKQDGNFNIYAK